MANGIILPTFDLVTDCLPYDKVFRFLRGGVKDVIRESIVASSFYNRHAIQPEMTRSSLLTNILHEFDGQFDRELSDRRIEPNTNVMDEYQAQIAIIEFVVSEIEDVTQVMVHDFMRTHLFDVDERETRWRGRDLLVFLRSFGRLGGERHATAYRSDGGRGRNPRVFGDDRGW
jgi:hypothetical protein